MYPDGTPVVVAGPSLNQVSNNVSYPSTIAIWGNAVNSAFNSYPWGNNSYFIYVQLETNASCNLATQVFFLGNTSGTINPTPSSLPTSSSTPSSVPTSSSTPSSVPTSS